VATTTTTTTMKTTTTTTMMMMMKGSLIWGVFPTWKRSGRAAAKATS
jgi:hypothetical protein